MDRGRITFGNTCTCGGVPGPCVPSCEGSIIGQSRGVSALDGRAERAVVLAVLGSSILRAAAAVHGQAVGFGKIKLVLTPPLGLDRRIGELASAPALTARAGAAGRVSVRWHCAPNKQAPGPLTLEWLESGDPPVEAPSNSGYGRGVITEHVSYEAARLVSYSLPKASGAG